ncbi:hypothetical protein H4R34_005388 [Dimargaris verticillata]|uniref:Uncharacterized protein n=1 Tax=Dimargaris verticillata TaxID=2761393 RepID=A0A9W8B0P6_9FUNG|nr:hypothetical protein H4R34_005388 [Dimargaris verticillata]
MKTAVFVLSAILVVQLAWASGNAPIKKVNGETFQMVAPKGYTYDNNGNLVKKRQVGLNGGFIYPDKSSDDKEKPKK